MKKTVVTTLLLTLSAVSWAQDAVIKGKFVKILQKRNVDQIYLYKPEEANLTPISMILFARHDQTFQSKLTGSDLNVIRYIGVEDEIYPVYMRKGEELSIDAGNGEITYSGQVNAENKVFADWYKMLAPLRKYSFTLGGRKLAPDHFAATLDSLAGPVEAFVRNIKTGNDSFDRYVKYMLPYSFKYESLLPFTQALQYNNKKEFPAFVVKLFKEENFADGKIWTLPFGYTYMQYHSFVKHLVYNSEMGFTEDFLIPEISNPMLRADFILKEIERQEYQNMAAFVAKNKQYMINADQKKRMNVFEKRANLKEPGGAWIDFAYPDSSGKVHHLADFAGKVVLIDVWATWCKPCLGEQPALEALEKSFEGKNVVFISLTIDTDKDKWKQMVADRKLSGLHLYTNNKGVIVDDYDVKEIPRFILFDKNGKTVMFDAMRPSDPKLGELIQSKL